MTQITFQHRGTQCRTNERAEWLDCETWKHGRPRWVREHAPTVDFMAAARIAADFSMCPWCGATGPQFNRSPAPHTYCDHA